MVRLERLLRIMALSIFLTRQLIPFLWSAVIASGKIMLLGVLAIWTGIPRSIEAIANEWLDRAMNAGLPSNIDNQLYWIFWLLALITVVVSWVILSFITVGLVYLIF
jgi:hypothetical protein